MPPLIGITGYFLDKIEAAAFGSIGSLGRDFAMVAYDYPRAVESAGGIPILLPIVSEKWIDSMLDRLDGLLLSGGADVDPFHYGETPKTYLGKTEPERDAFELELTRKALKRNLPIMAVCRGMQVLNVALGGTLYQDLEAELGTLMPHSQKPSYRKWQASQCVKISENCKLAEHTNLKEMWINTFHHQAVKALGEGLRPTAWCEDGVVEALESTNHDYVVGYQWHPEMMADHEPLQQQLFTRFVRHAARRAGGEMFGR